jgi:cold shock CspA family protein
MMLNIENQNQPMMTSDFESTLTGFGLGLREIQDRNLPENGRGESSSSNSSGKDSLVAPAAAARCTGVVKWFNPTKGFGFITPNSGGADVFVHQSEIQLPGFRSLGQGEPVEYELYDGEKGPKALKVTGPNGKQVKGAPRQTKPKVVTPKPSFVPDSPQLGTKIIKIGNKFVHLTSTQVPVSTPIVAPTTHLAKVELAVQGAVPSMYSTPSPATAPFSYILTNAAVPQTNYFAPEIAFPMSPQPMIIEQSQLMPSSYYPVTQTTQMGLNASTPIPFTQMEMGVPSVNPFAFAQPNLPTQMNLVTSPQVDTQVRENPFEQFNSFLPNDAQLPQEMQLSPMSPTHI